MSNIHGFIYDLSEDTQHHYVVENPMWLSAVVDCMVQLRVRVYFKGSCWF